MTQTDLNLAVARATGEPLSTVIRRGFSLADPAIVDFDPEPCHVEDRIVDWDGLEAERVGLLPPRPSRRPAFV